MLSGIEIFKFFISDHLNNAISEKRIDLAYPIKNFDSSKEVAVVSVFSDNIQYEFAEPWTAELESGNKRIKAVTYTRREPTSWKERLNLPNLKMNE